MVGRQRHPRNSPESLILILFLEATLTTSVHDAVLLAKGKDQCFGDKGPPGAREPRGRAQVARLTGAFHYCDAPSAAFSMGDTRRLEHSEGKRTSGLLFVFLTLLLHFKVTLCSSCLEMEVNLSSGHFSVVTCISQECGLSNKELKRFRNSRSS